MKKLLLIAIIFSCFIAKAQETETLHGLFKLPSTMLTTLKSAKVDAAGLNNDGKPFIISFWATWCKPCIRELSAIAEVYSEWQSETGVKLFAVSVDDARTSAQVKSLVNGKGWQYEVLLDPNSDLRRAMQVNAVPHSLVVNSNGDVVWQHTGYA